MTTFRVQLTGPVQVTAPDASVTPLSLREAALLAWLHVEGPTPRARVAGLLWPEGTESQARANLRQTLSRLRRSVGELVVDDESVLVLAADAGVWVDDAKALLSPMEFDALPEFAQWLASQRESAQRARERQAMETGQRCLDDGDLDGALAAADNLLQSQPENETGWRLRMEALYRRGDRAAAIAAWDACKLALRQAFGIAPSTATQELGRLILSSDDTPLASTRPGVLPVALRRPPQLIGRDAVCRQLARHLAAGGSVLLAGPGGMGKSRVLETALQERDATLWVGARPGDALVPGRVIGQVLEAALRRFTPSQAPAALADLSIWLPRTREGAHEPDEGQGLRSDLAWRRAREVVVQTLTACHANGLRLLAIDDLQFADEASLELLHLVLGHWLALSASAGAEAPCMLFGARVQELSPQGRALLETLSRHAQGHILELTPLGVGEIEALLQSLALPGALEPGWGSHERTALAQALHAAVGGSPAHVLEAVRHLALDGLRTWSPGAPLPVPDSLRDAMKRRLEHLPEDALHLAQLAAVAESDFDLALAACILGKPALALSPALVALEKAWVFDGSRFSHDLMAEAMHGLLPRALVPLLHRQVADYLASRGQAGAARIAHHLWLAGDSAQAAPWLLSAASAARWRWQLPLAAQTFERAAQGFVAAGMPDRACASLCDALGCWIELRQFEATQRALDLAWALAGHATEKARIRSHEVMHLFISRRMGEAVASARQLVEALTEGAADLQGDELVLALRSACLAVQGGLPASHVLALCEQVQGDVVQRGGEALAGFALARGGTLLWDGQPLNAAAELEPAWLSLTPDCDPYLRRTVGNQLMRVRQALGDLRGAVTIGLSLVSPEADVNDASFEADVLSLVAMMQIAAGQPAQGLQSMALMQARLRMAGEPMRELYASTMSLCCLALGRLEEAQRWLDDHTRPAGRQGYAMVDYPALMARARLAQACGTPVAPWIDALQAVGPMSAGGLLHRQVTLAALQTSALEPLQALLTPLRERGQLGLLRTLRLAAARSALAAGYHELARSHAMAALELAEHVDTWCDQTASVWLQCHEVLAAVGAREEAHRALRYGVQWVHAGAAQFTYDTDRRAWRQGNAIHRDLQARFAALQT
jgi:DNA-binding SARP family transcriptional activator